MCVCVRASARVRVSVGICVFACAHARATWLTDHLNAAAVNFYRILPGHYIIIIYYSMTFARLALLSFPSGIRGPRPIRSLEKTARMQSERWPKLKGIAGF